MKRNLQLIKKLIAVNNFIANIMPQNWMNKITLAIDHKTSGDISNLIRIPFLRSISSSQTSLSLLNCWKHLNHFHNFCSMGKTSRWKRNFLPVALSYICEKIKDNSEFRPIGTVEYILRNDANFLWTSMNKASFEYHIIRHITLPYDYIFYNHQNNHYKDNQQQH